MFYSLITHKRDLWYDSKECTIKNLISYMQNKDKLRDVQIDAIKTYLYLKIALDNKPLWELFYEGVFNTLDIESLEVSQYARDYFRDNPCALSLYQYATHKDDKGKQISKELEIEIKSHFDKIPYKQVFQQIFYGLDYTDYLFSLPMGAGKTFLMASFIYLDLYFAINESHNKNFSHNFLVLAPSGLKSSIIPSLKSIQNFNPAWVISEPSASKLKQMIRFEVLEATKSAKKSNIIRNPNVAKIASHQPFESLQGLVIITNAEKVILERLDDETNVIYKDLSEEQKAQWRASNELRNIIAQIPNLSILIDEVHHATSDEIKLRNVITQWTKQGSITSVLGFSGTPYISKADRTEVANITIQNKEITNVVHYYPIIKGIGNFLKKPTLKVSNNESRLEIIESGTKEFLNSYKDTFYSNGLSAKLAIYCGSIATLEEEIYPKVCEILNSYNLPSEIVLKFHGGNKDYSIPSNAQYEFDTLDSPLSQIRIILLVQIGKEGWDCKSLSGVILSSENDCPKNMVLQTSCRCLRQVSKDAEESALIYLNDKNASLFQEQLQKQHHISVQEFQNGDTQENIKIERFDRTPYLELPKVEFFELKVSYQTMIIESANPKESLSLSIDKKAESFTKELDYKSFKTIQITQDSHDIYKQVANFNLWLYEIAKKSFHFLTMQDLKPYKAELLRIFETITHSKDSILYFNERYDREAIESHIIKSFYDKRDFTSKVETISANASLLLVERLKSPIFVDNDTNFIPKQKEVREIIEEDKGVRGNPIGETEKQIIEQLKALGQFEAIKAIENQSKKNKDRDKTYHYLPYKTDSKFERAIFTQILALQALNDLGLEVYYNGDRALSEFSIKTYKRLKDSWHYIGRYTPDFLIIKREKKCIKQIMIIETKGEAYAESFKDKRDFMSEFIRLNNEAFKYNRFDFLYLQDDWSEAEILNTLTRKLQDFFTRDSTQGAKNGD